MPSSGSTGFQPGVWPDWPMAGGASPTCQATRGHLVAANDGSWVYFVRRFDRVGRGGRLHQEDFSLVVRNSIVCLSPAYDLLNTTLVLGNASEESALPLRGRKRKLTRNDWVDYLCRERLGLSAAILDPILHTLDNARDAWDRKIGNSYLSAPAKAGYREILSERRSRLFD